jgi:hypothetical protein
MDEIKVYHSVWKTLITILADLLIVALGIYAIQKDITPLIAWFLVIFFCFAVIITAYPLVKERITKHPYLTIKADCVKVDNRQGLEIRYADVDSFTLKRILVDGMIVVNYSNEKATPEGILVSDLTMKPKELLEILNERLIASKKDLT